MRKLVSLFLALTLGLLLCACSDPGPAMYIQPAQLTQEEENIVKLLGGNAQQRIFDFQVDDTVQRMAVNAYELVDGEWALFYGGGQGLTDTRGRIALDFDKLEEGLRVGIQSQHSYGSTAVKPEGPQDIPCTGWATSVLPDREEILYEREIPLVIQIVTTKNEIRSFDTTFFFHPQEYEKYGYEHVFAITALFSQIPLS